MTVDLHLHTHYSDGTWSPTELVEHAITIGLRHLAITDHDTISGITEAELAARGRIEIIPAVESNTIWTPNSEDRTDVHILGYFVDRQNTRLLNLLQRQRDFRSIHAIRCVEQMNREGIPITMELVQEFAGRGGIGKMHLAQAIIAAGGAKDASEAFDKFLTRGSAHYVERENITPHEAVEAIIAAGGVASIAHPGKDERILDLILALKQLGLGGIEAYHRMHSEEIVQLYVEFAERHI